MNVNDFELISQLLKKRSGLVLSEDKAYLLESRLNPVARKWGLSGFDELAQQVRKTNDEKLLVDITEAMTTNESFFFRDQKPFDQFRDVVLPYLLEHRAPKKSIRIWCAAASSGQEPYTLAMLLKEAQAKLAGWRVEIVGTDISQEILDKAKEGVYSQFEVQRGLPINLLVKYFTQVEDRWQLNDEIRNMVTFKNFNLLNSMSGMGQFDVIFCRNVLIYFDQPTKTQVLDQMAGLLANDGFLYLGGAETVLGISDRFLLIPGQRGIYGLANEGAVKKAV
ncbi:CheR family methyltransferase [Denitrobaculum tricleocarpae]|uniref:Chemotaxis protein methyltransferase n=1 Tax=Denitrobaculum tricleocarpae TaxID=2591009 RepID=A0A545T416_9PROT|nr:protein-glutamate O-methyltransferase [Denitrobaculum tricleocarpae]TQV71898.1 chemotaxis protein CheR [Denitrobaculum tricleocarpae]